MLLETLKMRLWNECTMKIGSALINLINLILILVVGVIAGTGQKGR